MTHFDKLFRGGKAADAERQQDPPTGVAAFGWVLSQLFADLTVDLIPEMKINNLNQNKHTFKTQIRSFLLCLAPCVKKKKRKVRLLAGHLRAGRKMPLPMIKWSFSRLEVGLSSSMLFPWRP